MRIKIKIIFLLKVKKDDFNTSRYFTIIPTFGLEFPDNFKIYKNIFELYFQVFRWKVYLLSVFKK